MLTGIMKPSNGSVFINGIQVENHPMAIKKLIGVLPEYQGYYKWMTAYEYLMHFYELFGGEKSKADQHVSYLLEKVGLIPKQRKRTIIKHFSRGMKQRLGIAKTLINNPKIIILDEPTLGLDPEGQRDIYELIRDLNNTLGITVFITSHLLKDIEALCNKVAIVKKGTLLVEDTIANLRAQYSENTSMEEIFLDYVGDDKELEESLA